MKTKLLVTGSTGQLGTEFCKQSATQFDVIGISRKDADIMDFEKIKEVLSAYKPDYVIHTAAYTDVDGCELDPKKAHQVNVVGTENVARAAKEVGALTVYFSTDYVFDGKKESAYVENDKPNPISVYGSTKLEGEKQVQGLGGNNIVIRTGWLYSKYGNNFVKRILRIANNTAAKPIRVVDDQFGSPTWTMDVVTQTLKILESKQLGVFHAASKGELSRFGFAKLIIDDLFPNAEVQPCLTVYTNRPAKRPPRSTLASSRLEELGIDMMRAFELTWSDFLDMHDKELLLENID